MKKTIRGFRVECESDVKKGADHLAYTLSYDEAYSFFKAARRSGQIKFEDRAGRNFTLIAKVYGSFELKKRKTGWF